MLVVKPYERERALRYAEKWALSRNPLFVDYTGRGGNCTNFVSQCIYAGSCVMNYTPVFGWYYITDNQRAPAWTGVTYLFNFLTGNAGEGPYGTQVGREEVEVGDVVQFYRAEVGWYHSLLVVGFDTDGEILLAAQSDDAYERREDSYTYESVRYIHLLGVRLKMPDTGDCYETLLSGEAIVSGEA